MGTRKKIEAAVGAVLEPRGYRKRRGTWRLTQPESVLVINLQKSGWGPSFYMNLGVYLRALGAEQDPPEFRCHIRTRVDRLARDPAPLVSALDLESNLSPEERVGILREAVEGYALPWLEARDSERKARAALLAEQTPTGLVMLIAKQHLRIEGRRSTSGCS